MGRWGSAQLGGANDKLSHGSDFPQGVSDALQCFWQVTVEDFEIVCKGLYRALCIREKYMQKSFQRFPKTPSKYLRNIDGEPWVANENFYPGK